jgi:hypothetical protein
LGCITRSPRVLPRHHRNNSLGSLGKEMTEMFLFFSNRLGCLGSLLISAALTILLIVIFTR